MRGITKNMKIQGLDGTTLTFKSHFNFRFQPSSNEGTRYDIEEGTREARGSEKLGER